jgi:hypothetical protein
MFSEKYKKNLKEFGESLEFCHSKSETGKRKKNTIEPAIKTPMRDAFLFFIHCLANTRNINTFL